MGNYCQFCGKAHKPKCRSPYDPPRYCKECGKKLKVLITPTSYRAICVNKGCGSYKLSSKFE